MPIPTDTFWNIKKLNRAFAISSVILVLITLWSVMQDYDKTWRKPQQHGRIWDAAMTGEKIQRSMSPTEKQKLDDLKSLVSDLDAQVKSGNIDFKGMAQRVDGIQNRYEKLQVLTDREQESLADIKAILTDTKKQEQLKKYSDLTQKIMGYEGEVSRRTFSFNNDKAEITVMENQLQDARTEKNEERVKELEKTLEPRRAKLNKDNELIFSLKEEARKAKEDRAEATKPIDDLRKLNGKLGGDVDLLRKKLAALQPDNVAAKFSSQLRKAPLLQFMNPEDKVRELVLPDVLSDLSFTRVATTDRCATCHVHIDRKEFTEERVLGYLEEQLASGRQVRFSAPRRPDDPTENAPGAAAMPEFWHLWGLRLLPPSQQRANVTRVNNILAVV